MSDTSVTGNSPVVTISADRMQAILRIPAAVSASTLSTESMVALLHDTGIPATDDVRGNIDRVIEQFRHDPSEVRLVVAQGIPPQRGADGQLVWEGEYGPSAAPLLSDANAPIGDADATEPPTFDEAPVNYYAQSPYVSVDEGEHIATLIAPEPGLPGFDVCGKRIPPLAGKPFPLRYDGSIKIDQLGRVTAAQPGLLMCGFNTIRVSPTLDISGSVDFHTGHIDFDGSVIIGDGIRDRFTVKATQHIIVNGLIEAATIDCRGMLRSEGGMAGRDVGSLDIRHDAALRYLVGVTGRIGRDLLVQREIINCHLTVARYLDLNNGSLIGGEVTVDRGVKVATLGSDAAVPTILRLGRVPAVSDMLNRLYPMLGQADEQLKELKQRYEDVLAKPESDPGLRRQLRSAIDNLAENREVLRRQFKELKARFNEKCRIDLDVFRMIHPGVTIVLPRLRIKFVEPVKGPVVIRRGADGKFRIDHADGDQFDLRAVAHVTTTHTW